MHLKRSFITWILLVGDVIVLYLALFLVLVLRYQNGALAAFEESHVVPFTTLFAVWIIMFYIAGLYDVRRLRNNIDFLKTLALTLFVGALVGVAFFYFLPASGITPKTNLFLFILTFAILESIWRRTFNVRASFREGLNRVLLLDKSARAQELHEALTQNPQMGYVVKLWLDSSKEEVERVREAVTMHDINLVVVPAHLKHDAATAKILYALLALGVEVRDTPAFYEIVFRKIPVEDVNESWFVDQRMGERRFYDDLKRGLEVLIALVLLIVLLPLELLVALLIKLTSKGPVIFKQIRSGKNGVPFTLYKFRSMKALAADGSAELSGAAWSAAKDPRSTAFGQLLRASHLDELPQLWNIIRGNLSFVGPRPERPEIEKNLIPQIPYYEIRHLIKPGVSGWAQISYRYGASVEDAVEKLRYDIYYIKNRSLILDLAIAIKTIKSFFVNQE